MSIRDLVLRHEELEAYAEAAIKSGAKPDSLDTRNEVQQELFTVVQGLDSRMKRHRNLFITPNRSI